MKIYIEDERETEWLENILNNKAGYEGMKLIIETKSPISITGLKIYDESNNDEIEKEDK